MDLLVIQKAVLIQQVEFPIQALFDLNGLRRAFLKQISLAVMLDGIVVS